LGVGVVVCLEQGSECFHMVPSKPHHLLPRLNPEWFYLSGLAYPSCPGKEAIKCVVVVVVVQVKGENLPMEEN